MTSLHEFTDPYTVHPWRNNLLWIDVLRPQGATAENVCFSFFPSRSMPSDARWLPTASDVVPLLQRIGRSLEIRRP